MIGIDSCWVSPSLDEQLQAVKESAADFIVASLFHPRNVRSNDVESSLAYPLTRSDMLLSSREWSSSVVGKLSHWTDIDNENRDVRMNAEYIIKKELSWALHIGMCFLLTVLMRSMINHV
jgi:type II protein arginine methyltransferase